jgi:DNA-directed RNA polymerase specialized sigma24 family protein
VVQHAHNAPDRAGELIVGFLAGDPQAREALPRDLGDLLTKIAGEVAPDLKVRGLAADVVQEMFRILLTRPAGHYDPDRGSPWAYLRVMLQLAARGVREQEAVAGTPRRPKRDANGEPGIVVPPVPIQDGVVPDDGTEYVEDTVISWIVTAEFLDGVPDDGPVWLRRALSLVVEGLTITQTAEAVDVSRFTLRRALDRWAAPAAGILR